MLGNWSTPASQWPPDTLPDYCVGYAYIVTPSLAARLVTAGIEAIQVFIHFCFTVATLNLYKMDLLKSQARI